MLSKIGSFSYLVTRRFLHIRLQRICKLYRRLGIRRYNSFSILSFSFIFCNGPSGLFSCSHSVLTPCQSLVVAEFHQRKRKGRFAGQFQNGSISTSLSVSFRFIIISKLPCHEKISQLSFHVLLFERQHVIFLRQNSQ